MEEFESRRVAVPPQSQTLTGRAGFNVIGIVGWVCVVCRVTIPLVKFRKGVKGVTRLVSGPSRF